ncbi:MAG: diacylglycerol kinase family protein [bacterium]
METKTTVVLNPRARNGRTGKMWPRIEAEIAKHLSNFEPAFTEGPRHATELTRNAIKNGSEFIVALGGDGTINEVVNGFFENGSLTREGTTLGIVSGGTGGDFIKTLGIPRAVPEAAAVLAGGRTMVCDAGRIRCAGHDGAEIEHYFINIADFGLGGLSVEKVNSTTKIFGSFLTFFIGIARASFAYKNQPVEITIDGERIGERRIKSVVIANGQYFGGGMRMAKEAAPDDGLFEMLILGDLRILEGALLMPRMYRGDILDHPKVERFKGRVLSATSDRRVLLDVDGEQVGRLPATFELIPACIPVRVPHSPVTRGVGSPEAAP